MNALDLVPAFRRQIGVYTHGSNTSDSALAGYIADAVQALTSMWGGGQVYEVEFTSPMTYNITPDVAAGDIRPIILMASIIYKMGTISILSYVDGDFSWNTRGSLGTQLTDAERKELLGYVPVKLAKAVAGQFLGYKSVYNPENFDWTLVYNYLWSWNW